MSAEGSSQASPEESEDLFNFDEIAQAGKGVGAKNEAPAIEELLKSLGDTQAAVQSFASVRPEELHADQVIGAGPANSTAVPAPTFAAPTSVAMGLPRGAQRALWAVAALLAALFLLNTLLVFRSMRSDDELRAGLLALTRASTEAPPTQGVRPELAPREDLDVHEGKATPPEVLAASGVDHALLALRAEFSMRLARIEEALARQDGDLAVRETYALLALVDSLPPAERSETEGRASFLLAEAWKVRALPRKAGAAAASTQEQRP